jgi:uncharacterized protein (TIGR03067 family)
MRAFIVTAAVVASAALLVPAGAEEPKDATQAELKKLQGLWQHIPGGMEQLDGNQIVRGPAAEGPWFFIHDNTLIWLDREGKPSGEAETIALDPKAEPKRIKFTRKGDDGKERVLREGIYRWDRVPGVLKGEAATDVLTIHIALEGKAVPKQFLELNKPVKGVDGCEWLVARIKLGQAGASLMENLDKLQGDWKPVKVAGDVGFAGQLSFDKKTLVVTYFAAPAGGKGGADVRTSRTPFELKEDAKGRVLAAVKEGEKALAVRYRFDGDALIIEEGKRDFPPEVSLRGRWERVKGERLP